MQFEQTWCHRADTPEHTPHCSGNDHHMADVVTVCAIPWETLQQWAHIPCMFNISMRSGNCSCIFVHSKATHYTTRFNSIHAVKWKMWVSNDSWLWRLPSSTIWCSTVWYKFQWTEDRLSRDRAFHWNVSNFWQSTRPQASKYSQIYVTTLHKSPHIWAVPKNRGPLISENILTVTIIKQSCPKWNVCVIIVII